MCRCQASDKTTDQILKNHSYRFTKTIRRLKDQSRRSRSFGWRKIQNRWKERMVSLIIGHRAKCSSLTKRPSATTPTDSGANHSNQSPPTLTYSTQSSNKWRFLRKNRAKATLVRLLKNMELEREQSVPFSSRRSKKLRTSPKLKLIQVFILFQRTYLSTTASTETLLIVCRKIKQLFLLRNRVFALLLTRQ